MAPKTMEAYPRIREGIEMISRKQGDKILPIPGEQNTLVTSALPYINNVPHLGNIIGSTLSADVYARYSRTLNRPTFYVCGTDEYGTATEVKALKDGVTPQALCDKYYQVHKDVYDWFELSFDNFGRTARPEHTEVCQEAFLKLKEEGMLEVRTLPQPYCSNCDRYLADRYVVGTCPNCQHPDARGDQCELCSHTHDPFDLINPRCEICSSAPVPRDSSHFYLRLDHMQPELEKWVKQVTEKGVWSSQGRQITDAWLKIGLKEMCITRDLKWGVKVPLKEYEDKKVLYVWYDAPFGYPSITKNYAGDAWEQWWKNPKEVRLVQFMGKDNVRFHAVMWPSILLATRDNWTMLDSISVTDYLNYENTKFSKSRSVGVFGDAVAKIGIPSSVWRYYLISNRPEAGDTQFTWADFVMKANAELLNNLGNLVNRVLKFINANYDGVLPDPEIPSLEENGEYPLEDELDVKFFKEVNSFLTSYRTCMDGFRFRLALSHMLSISARGNQFLQDNRLDNSLKANEPKRCARVLLLVTNLIYHLTPLIHPFMPSTSDSILRQLNAPARTVPSELKIDILSGHKLSKPEYLFKRIDPKNVEVWKKQFSGADTEATAATGDKKSKSQQKKDAKQQKKERLAAAAAASGNEEPLKKAIEEAADGVAKMGVTTS